MKGQPERKLIGGWNAEDISWLIDELLALRKAMLSSEVALDPFMRDVDASYAESARNLAHYLAFRKTDVRPLQIALSNLGISSLGRAESNVLASLDNVVYVLHCLINHSQKNIPPPSPEQISHGNELLSRHAEALFGQAPRERLVRIMVTMPSEAATDFELVLKLVEAGMDVARINCAHDAAPQWSAMIINIRDAAKKLRRSVPILMDLGGPKLRTGHLESNPPVLKLRPSRDAYGRVLTAAQLVLYPEDAKTPIEGMIPRLAVDPAWLLRLEVGDSIRLTDARGSARKFAVIQKTGQEVLAECNKTVYLVKETVLTHTSRKNDKPDKTSIRGLPELPGMLKLHVGDMLRLTRSEARLPSSEDGLSADAGHAIIPCTLPEVFSQVQRGERILFDDGRIGGVVVKTDRDWIDIKITSARPSGEKLLGDKGINLPDSILDLPALTDKDLQDLLFIVQHADLVGLSFTQRASDVEELRSRLSELEATNLGVILKIETQRGFANIGELLFAAMGFEAAGIMIARGDLAIECGYERLAEVQEEILCVTEAAHIPVIWATQVLETLAKTGKPTRAEISDASMGERAECVMLNKGPFIAEAVHSLDDILRRMQAHQMKKRPLLRALQSLRPPEIKAKKTHAKSSTRSRSKPA